MVSKTESIVIVGGGLTAAKAAEKLRSEGFEGTVDIVGAEEQRPYERPPLSKGYLLGDDELESVFVHEAGWYDANAIGLRLGSPVVGLDAESAQLTLENTETISYDKLLITTGSRPRVLVVPGVELDGVHYLRSVDDSKDLRAALETGGQKVVLVGGGWIGLEVASAARKYGNDVAVVEPQAMPLRSAIGDELGGVFAALHREHGVDLKLGSTADEIVGKDGKVTGLRTGDGDVVPADMVIIGVGAIPNSEFAADAGLLVDNGIVVDAAFRTSHDFIWAAGDVANTFYPRLDRHVRVEHWDNAIQSGEAAARSMLGMDVSYDRLPYFFTDQYDLGMEFTGYLDPDRTYEVAYVGDPASREFIAFWLDGNRVVAGMNVNVWDVADHIRALIESGESVDAGRLAKVAGEW